MTTTSTPQQQKRMTTSKAFVPSFVFLLVVTLLFNSSTTTTSTSVLAFTTTPSSTSPLLLHPTSSSSRHHTQRRSPLSWTPTHFYPTTTTTKPFTTISFLRQTISNEDEVEGKKRGPLNNSYLSAGLLIVLDVLFRRVFVKCNIAFPSSLGGCCLLLTAMLVLPGGSTIFETLNPGATLLAKWLPVFFVPSLITLPLVGSIGPPTEILKIFTVIVVGFLFTLFTTAGSVVGIRNPSSLSTTTETGTTDNVDQDEDQQVVSTTTTTSSSSPPTPPFSKSLVYQLRTILAATSVSSIIFLQRTTTTSIVGGPLVGLFLLSATLHNFVVGARLDKKITKIVHPLVTCTGLTWTMAWMLAKLTSTTFVQMLQAYKVGSLWSGGRISAGAGDILLFLLGPAVLSLAMSMYDKRRLVQENWKEVLTGVGVSSIGGLVGTACMVRACKIAIPSLRLALLSRNITSPLAMAIASILGANVGLAVAMVVVTGLIGANFGATLLSSVGIHDPVARGMGIGAAAHGLGTAAFVSEKDAFPFAAISMALTATACTCLVSVPVIKKVILQLALGGV